MNAYEALLEICFNLEIDEFGITDTQPFSDIFDRLAFNDEKNKVMLFTKANINARIDPRLTMSTAKTIICVLFPYKQSASSEKPPNVLPQNLGKIVSGDVFFGCDYHVYVRMRLNAVANTLKERFGGTYMCFCDTGPLVDKEIALRCGLSKYGKNSLAINRRYGSMFYIGYILTDLHIENNLTVIKDVKPANKTDNRLYEGCSGCYKCISACPVKALGNSIYNSNEHGFIINRCISYISQKKGDLTVDEASCLNTLYGCHICQNVCPANSSAQFSRYVDMSNLADLSNRAFKKTFGDTAACWIGKKTFLRNMHVLKAKWVVGTANNR